MLFLETFPADEQRRAFWEGQGKPADCSVMPPYHIKHCQSPKAFFMILLGLLNPPAGVMTKTGLTNRAASPIPQPAWLAGTWCCMPASPHIPSQHDYWFSGANGVEYHSEDAHEGRKMAPGQDALKSCSNNCAEERGSAGGLAVSAPAGPPHQRPSDCRPGLSQDPLQETRQHSPLHICRALDAGPCLLHLSCYFHKNPSAPSPKSPM